MSLHGLQETVAVMRVLEAATAPVSIVEIARHFVQGKQIEKRVGLVVAALARLGHLSSGGPDRFAAKRRLIGGGFWSRAYKPARAVFSRSALRPVVGRCGKDARHGATSAPTGPFQNYRTVNFFCRRNGRISSHRHHG
jgi:hypothetical protein